ncbi:MAG TPA: SDR family oxidoreductase [Rubrivivax sp.]|nr:SDR family oxidoreductase [Rubrivivax sp.]
MQTSIQSDQVNQTDINQPAVTGVPTTRASRRHLLAGLGAAAAGLVVSAPASAQASATPIAINGTKVLQGKVAIVTGARNNQGRAYAVALARLGADVLLHFHRAETQAQNDESVRLVRAEGVRVATAQGDLGEVANVKRVFDTALREFGHVDIVVNTVGLIVKKPLAEVTEADYERSQRANAKATLFVMQEAARRMADNGRIIHIGTSLTAGSTPGYALYAGTKAPAEEFTRMLAKEIGKRGITVNNVAPGPLDNSFFHAAETPQSVGFAANLSVAGRLGREADITPVVEFLASPQAQWLTGQVLWVNGGYLTR